MNAYRIIRIADPRSRGACAWYEIEGCNAAGDRWHVATCDDRQEARDLLAAIEAQIAAAALPEKNSDSRLATL
jgi:hypothetical protein